MIYGSILFLLALSLILGSIISYSQKRQDLQVVFLDVGQGDSILISQGSYQVLVDGGRDGKLLLNKLGKYIPFWDRKIEAVVETHPDQDHIAGLIDVLKSYDVSMIVKTDYPSDSQTFKALGEESSKEKAQDIEARMGTEIKFPEGAVLKIIYPFSEVGNMGKNQSNESSVIAKLEYGENRFLLTGDLPKEEEKKIIDSGADIGSVVIKISHHGSKYSNSSEFLEKVNPKEAVISVGKDNAYGHPNQEVINLLAEKNILILRTDERGDIVYECKKDAACIFN